MTDLSPEQARKRIEDAPYPMTGRITDYEQAAEACARAMLITAEQRPDLLDVEDLPPLGAANNEKLWAATEENWPELDDWLGGITGFQFGWAHNIVRYILGSPPTGNPAIVEVSE